MVPVAFIGAGAGASYVVPVLRGVESGASLGRLVTVTPLELELGWL